MSPISGDILSFYTTYTTEYICFLLIVQQSISTPQDRCLSMIISGNARTVHIILLTVFLSRSDTNFGKVIFIVYIIAQAQPGSACNGSKFFFIQPSVLNTQDHSIGKHCRSGCFSPKVGLVYQLIPQSVLVHIFLQIVHHQKIAFHYPVSIRIIFRQVEQ